MATSVKRARESSAQKANNQARLKQLERLRTEMTARIQLERSAGPPDRNKLEVAIRAADAEVIRLEGLMGQARTQAKKRKREIDEWKTWYERIPALDKGPERRQLDSEIGWRAAEIVTLEHEIQRLFPAQIEARARGEEAKLSLAALDSGAHLLPLDRDPRLQALVAECERARRQGIAVTPRRRGPVKTAGVKKPKRTTRSSTGTGKPTRHLRKKTQGVSHAK